MSTNADPVLIKKVIHLINKLRAALEAELASSRKNEKTRRANYRKLRADLVDDEHKSLA